MEFVRFCMVLPPDRPQDPPDWAQILAGLCYILVDLVSSLDPVQCLPAKYE